MMACRLFLLGALILLALAARAQAAPRDEMLSGIFRCTSIADERTFLDCVYGAAQPVRAELGLAPAPPAQTRLVPPSGAAAMAAPPASAAAAPSPSRPQESSGFFARVFGGKVETAPTPVTAYSFNAGGFFTITLGNGQVWRQIDGDFEHAHWSKPAAGYTATIIAGALGSSNLKVSGDAAIYKVQRLR